MKRLLVAGLILAALVQAAWAAEEKFTATVPPEELVAIGLSGLTPVQLARLDSLVEAYKSGALASARRAANEALVAKHAAEAKAAQAEAKVEVVLAEAKAEVARVEAAKVEVPKAAPSPGLITKAKELLSPFSKANSKVVAIESSIPGKFRGWEPRQVFTLANGQKWQVANADSYYSPLTENPRVQIVPGAIAGYWMRFPDLGAEVRVNPISEN